MSIEITELEELISILPPGRARDKYIKKLVELKNDTQRDRTYQDIPASQEEIPSPKEQGHEGQKLFPGQVKYCSWREMDVPVEECNPPCYIYRVKECKHLVTWWEERLKWLENNPPKLSDRERQEPPASNPEAFDPDGALVSLLECAGRKGVSDNQIASIIDDLIQAKSLKSPWGIRIKNAPGLGDYWVLSDDEAKKLIPGDEVAFTAEDIRLLAEVREIFGAKVIEVKKEGKWRCKSNQ
jgi:hypothetical protein